MKILDYYLGKTVAGTTLTVMGILVAVFSFFEFVDELDQMGRGRYGLLQVLEFIGLSTPRLAYELFPVAALIGSLVGLGTLVSNSELTVIRSAGVSLGRTVVAVMKAGVVIMIMAVILGELIAPPSDQLAQYRRSIAKTNQITLKTQNGFWARDGQSYINIRRLLPGDRIEEIYIYEFDAQNRLKLSTWAKRARYVGGQWLLEDIEQTLFGPQIIRKQHIDFTAWESMLDPELINMVVIKPHHLSIWTLWKYIRFLKTNGQNSLTYEQALWFKIIYPVATAVMVFLAIPIVLGTPRTSTVGQRVVLGSCIGLAFHIINKGMSYVGVVFNLNPALSVVSPTFFTFMIALLLMRRVA